MKISSLVVKAVVLGGSLAVSATAIASNPFQRPEVKVVEKPDYETPQEDPVVNPYADNTSLEEISKEESQPTINPLLKKESVVFKGSINGVDIYFDKATGQYIHDKKELETINLLSSSLPELQQVNY